LLKVAASSIDTRNGAHLIEQVEILFHIMPSLLAFSSFTEATELGFKLQSGAIEHFCLVRTRARNPILSTQFIENGATNTEFSVGF